jgi:uncharacterized membrane protein
MSIPPPSYPPQPPRRGEPEYTSPPAQPGPPWQPQRLEHPIDRGAEQVLSALAHGAIAFGILGFGFIISLAISGIVWLYGRRSPTVRFHAEQAGCYQCIVILVNLVLVIVLGSTTGLSLFNLIVRREDVTTLTTGTIVGVCLFLIWFGGSILYGVFAALMVLAGKPFKYPVIGNRFH